MERDEVEKLAAKYREEAEAIRLLTLPIFDRLAALKAELQRQYPDRWTHFEPMMDGVDRAIGGMHHIWAGLESARDADVHERNGYVGD